MDCQNCKVNRGTVPMDFVVYGLLGIVACVFILALFTALYCGGAFK
jgi:hypothetical protein